MDERIELGNGNIYQIAISALKCYTVLNQIQILLTTTKQSIFLCEILVTLSHAILLQTDSAIYIMQ